MNEFLWLYVLVGFLLVVVLGLVAWAIVSVQQAGAARDRVDAAWLELQQRQADRVALLPAESPVVEASRNAQTPAAAAALEPQITQMLRERVAAEPGELETRVREADDALQAARRRYNPAVREFNAKVQRFPASLFLRGESARPREFYELPGGGAAEAPRVQF